MRTEQDSLGFLEVEDDAFYGIHSLRSIRNFPYSGEKINPYLIKAYLQIKLAAIQTNHKIGLISDQKLDAIYSAIEKLLAETEKSIEENNSKLYEKVIVDPYQGGAGTSLNMNINEIIANTALELSGKKFGEYSYIHPIDDVNLSQSTNDTYVTALKIASLNLLRGLTASFAELQRELQKKEQEFSGVMKLGRTQLQDAVPITLGQEFGAYAEAIARDRWRLYNGEERLRSVNLGGSAVGNSINASRDFVRNVILELKRITNLPVAKAENLIDSTQNLDVFVEVHGLVKSGAVSIIKICNDLRFLSSGPRGGIGEIILPDMQAGSSIMPGKINPVILENAIQIAEAVKGNDVVISNIAGAGNLELNSFTPLLAHLFLKSLTMMKDMVRNLAQKCISGIEADRERCKENLIRSSAIAAVLINKFGFDSISQIVKEAHQLNISFTELLKEKNIISEKDLMKILQQEIGIKIE